MELGYFMMPAHQPWRDLAEGHYHDLDTIEYLDKTGFAEVWVGEHYMLKSEPHPSPDILIAQAISRTRTIRLGTGGFMLPFHHPAELAHRICLLDQISKGRFMVGIGASGTQLDLRMFGIDPTTSQNREMTEESISIMVKFWESDGPFEYKGKYWSVSRPADSEHLLSEYHLKPYQKPYPPIGVTGLSARSPTLSLAGQRGWIPISTCFSTDYLLSHWESVSEGAAKAGREPPPRESWRVCRNVFVGETDEEARRFVVNGEMGRYNRDFILPMMANGNALDNLKHRPDVADSDVTIEYLAKNSWIVGSADTVAEKLAEMQEISGGFGVLLAYGYDHLDEKDRWRESLSALSNDVLPRLNNTLSSAA